MSVCASSNNSCLILSDDYLAAHTFYRPRGTAHPAALDQEDPANPIPSGLHSFPPSVRFFSPALRAFHLSEEMLQVYSANHF